jgi:hypothetical protein
MSTDDTHAIAVQQPQSTELSVDAVLGRMGKVQELMRRAMQLGVDYGTIPGTKSKPTLLKPGAEKLCVMFRLAPKYRTEKHFHDDGHLTVESTCQIYDLAENFLGEAAAMCSTREAKYAYRRSNRKCPSCGAEAILRSKFPPRDDPQAAPGWYCFAKKGGCGTNFDADDVTITGQTEGRAPNEDLADSYNTVLRIAEKRALIGAVRLVTGSSALFDEEIPAAEVEPEHTPFTPPVQVADKEVLRQWQEWLTSEPTIDQINDRLPEVKKLPTAADRTAVFQLLKDSLAPHGITFDLAAKIFQFTKPAEEAVF